MAMANSMCALSLSRPSSLLQLSSRSGEVAGTGLQKVSSSTGRFPRMLPARFWFNLWPVGRICVLTGKKANNGYKVSFSNHRTKKLQGANLQYKRLWWEEGKRFVKLRVCTQALKTIDKKGLEVMAKEAGINLADY